MSDTPTRRLLLVHAHPDDESIGTGATMARYVAEGAGVTLVTCTAGERGSIVVEDLEHLGWQRDDTLGQHRRGELEDAMKALGVTDHRYLGGFGRYSDSGMMWHEDGYAIAGPDRPDNAFWDADLTEAATLLVEVIREVRPQVMSTYDQFGNYGHPDHIQAHRVATYAADLAAVPTYRPDLGEAWQISKIYWQAMSESRWRRSLRAIRAAGDTTSFEGLDPEGPLPMATADENLAAEIDASTYADQKVAALQAHRSQIRVDGPFFALAHNEGNEVLGIESFRIARGTPAPRPDSPNGLEDDLFAGL
jgi:N-acetyl-1-D-myo-inositol-2-amino-2-deoxy-alpha-D-glucopyranoside deacetylase